MLFLELYGAPVSKGGMEPIGVVDEPENIVDDVLEDLVGRAAWEEEPILEGVELSQSDAAGNLDQYLAGTGIAARWPEIKRLVKRRAASTPIGTVSH